MSQLRLVCAIIASIAAMIGSIPYIVAILRKRAKPIKATWLVWTALDVLAVASMYAKDALNIPLVFSTAGAATILLLSFKYGQPGWTKLDKACLTGAATGVGLWVILHDPLPALIACQFAELIGSIPTFRSLWRDPTNEDPTAWMVAFVGGLFTLLSLSRWNVSTWLQPLNFTLIESIIVFLIFIRPKLRHA